MNSLIFLCCALAPVVLAQEMLPEDMPNPMNPTHHVDCNLAEDRTPVINGQQKYFICDPNQVMNKGEGIYAW